MAWPYSLSGAHSSRIVIGGSGMSAGVALQNTRCILPLIVPPLVLYSVNTWLKFHVQETFRGGVHFVWCSECFDARKLASYTTGALVAPSSNPAEIYTELANACRRGDWHSARIEGQKSVLLALARRWLRAGEITREQQAEIALLVKKADFKHWRPLVYVIPYEVVSPRVLRVPVTDRASIGPELKVIDLKRDEFDIIEFAEGP